MVDNNNDEYQFADMDVISPDPMGDEDVLSEKSYTVAEKPPSEKNNVVRNAIFAIILVLMAMLIYKFIASFGKKISDGAAIPTTPLQNTTPAVEPVQPTQPIEQPTVSSGPDVSELSQRISSLETSQQSMSSDINNLNNQLNGINQNINTLNTKMADLNQIITNLANKVDQQAEQITKLLIVRAPRPITSNSGRRMMPEMVYYIQAVIPGRAWLIASNGSTLTVREGTKIRGYGIIKMIDPNQGRILTSSGRVIRFSQQDS